MKYVFAPFITKVRGTEFRRLKSTSALTLDISSVPELSLYVRIGVPAGQDSPFWECVIEKCVPPAALAVTMEDASSVALAKFSATGP